MPPDAPNKFAKMMQTAREHQNPAPDDGTPELPPPERSQSAARPIPVSQLSRGRGRPAIGKRSDPDYESTTVFLRRETKIAAARLLLGEKGQDLSDVLEKLLSGWVRKHS